MSQHPHPFINRWPQDWASNNPPSMVSYGMYPNTGHNSNYVHHQTMIRGTNEPVVAGVKRSHDEANKTSITAGSKDHHVLWTRAYDKPIPDPVKAKCKPLYCELCSVNLNSVIQAKMHYEGKSHEKKARFALQSWAKENNTVPPKKVTKSNIASDSTAQPRFECLHDPKQELYCGPCDTPFTSHAHAQQHFAGRNHQRIMNGLAPLKAGYFNTRTGKWQRQPPPSEGMQDKASPNFPIIGETSTPPPPSLPPPPPPPPPSQDNGEGLIPKYFCDVCGINATSQGQLTMHLSGRNHKMKFAKKNMHGSDHSGSMNQIQLSIKSESTGEYNTKKVPKMKDYSIYRTPSGNFYCALCNLSVNSEHQFVQHMASRKHKLKESSAKGKKPKISKQ